jgi:hypothetical protein
VRVSKIAEFHVLLLIGRRCVIHAILSEWFYCWRVCVSMFDWCEISHHTLGNLFACY